VNKLKLKPPEDLMVHQKDQEVWEEVPVEAEVEEWAWVVVLKP
jgi:hypothetical protein